MATVEDVPPKIVVIPLSRSHSFNQRECDLTEPQKVGRPVDKKKITPHNLIFDCRVLSRNHALIWFDNGKFFIQDTKSSNGTFVNDCRLSASGEESTPRELATRDVVQFGVNVNVDKRVTHGCIIATIKLFVNGKELPGPDPDVQQIVQVIQNCVNKEMDFETKLVSMQEAMSAALAMAKDGMIKIVKEDELLSRLEMLENQLHVYSRNINQDDLKKQLVKALEEKHINTVASKEKVQQILQEKIECNTRLSQVQRDYDKAEEEFQKYKTLYEALKQEHSQQIAKLTNQVKGLEKQKNDLLEQLKEEKEIALAGQESVKSELERIEVKLEESQDRLTEVTVELEIARQRGFLSSSDPLEGGNGPQIKKEVKLEESQDSFTDATMELEIARQQVFHTSSDPLEGGNEPQIKTEAEEDPLMATIISPLGSSQYSSTGDENLQDKLESSQKQIEQLSEELRNIENDKKELYEQLEQLRGQLVIEQNEKNALILKQEEQLSGPTSVEGHEQGNMSNQATLENELGNRENQLLALKEEKDQLLARVNTLESVTKNSDFSETSQKHELMEQLTESRRESNELKLTIASLEQSLKEVQLQVNSSPSSLDPSPVISPDPRIKALSVITLASIAVALISALIAYFF